MSGYYTHQSVHLSVPSFRLMRLLTHGDEVRRAPWDQLLICWDQLNRHLLDSVCHLPSEDAPRKNQKCAGGHFPPKFKRIKWIRGSDLGNEHDTAKSLGWLQIDNQRPWLIPVTLDCALYAISRVPRTLQNSTQNIWHGHFFYSFYINVYQPFGRLCNKSLIPTKIRAELLGLRDSD